MTRQPCCPTISSSTAQGRYDEHNQILQKPKPATFKSGAMESEDGLDSLQTIAGETLIPEQYVCNSIEDLQLHLRQMLDLNAKALTPERVAADFYLDPNVTFKVTLPEHDSLATGNEDTQVSIDAFGSETLGSADKSSDTDGTTRPAAERTFSCLDAVTDQPVVAPHLQSAIGRSILASIIDVDRFGWSLKHRTYSKKHGWRILFVCRDSLENPDRKQNRRKSANSAAGRMLPTFDCKGVVKIIFSASKDTIIVKYAHSPIHRTSDSRKEVLSSRGPSSSTSKREDTEISQWSTLSQTPSIPHQQHGSDQYRSPYLSEQSSLNLQRSQNVEHDPSIGSFQHESGSYMDSQDSRAQQSSPIELVQPSIPILFPAPQTSYQHDQELYEHALRLLADHQIDINSFTQEQFVIFINQLPDLQMKTIELFKTCHRSDVGVMMYADATASNQEKQVYEFVGPLSQIGMGLPPPTTQYPDPEGLEDVMTPGMQLLAEAVGAFNNAAQPPHVSVAQTPLLQPNSAEKKIRVKTGCLTCRRRKTKCDEQKPVCARCVKTKLNCTWP